MRCMRWVAIAMLLACGCTLTPKYQTQTAYTYNVWTDGVWVPHAISVGMTSSEVIAALGPPVRTAHGRNCSLYWQFAGVFPGLTTMELGFKRGRDLVVVWVESGVVMCVGAIPHHYATE